MAVRNLNRVLTELGIGIEILNTPAKRQFFSWNLFSLFSGKKREIRIGNVPRKSGEEGKQSKEKGKEEEDPFEIMERIMRQRQKDLEKKYGRRPVSSDVSCFVLKLYRTLSFVIGASVFELERARDFRHRILTTNTIVW